MDDDVPSMSGTLVTGLVEVAREVLGPSAVSTGLDEAPAWARDRVLSALPGRWVPIEASELAFGSIARVAGRDLPELHLELARRSVARAVLKDAPILILDWPDAPDWPLRGSRAGIETVMTAAGRRDVRVEARRTPEGAVFVITWA